MVYAAPELGKSAFHDNRLLAGVCVLRLMAFCLHFDTAGCFPEGFYAEFHMGFMRHPFDAYFLEGGVLQNMEIIFAVIGIVVGLAIGFFVGMGYRKKVAEREIGSAEMEATRLINEAIRSGESRKKELLLEAKDEIHRSRTEHDKEVKERRAELSKQERR